MELNKDTIIQFLKDHGRSDDASRAADELPDKVDADRDVGLLSKFGIDVQDLLGKLPGGLGDKLGGVLGDK